MSSCFGSSRRLLVSNSNHWWRTNTHIKVQLFQKKQEQAQQMAAEKPLEQTTKEVPEEERNRRRKLGQYFKQKLAEIMAGEPS